MLEKKFAMDIMLLNSNMNDLMIKHLTFNSILAFKANGMSFDEN
jgi:hypothetical protein